MPSGFDTYKKADSVLTELELFVVQNQSGQYFRAKGYGGYGDTWVSDIKKAKIYTKIGTARGRVSWFANNYPAYGVPKILKLQVYLADSIDETARVQKQKKNKEIAELSAKKRRSEQERERLLQQEKEIKAKLERLEKDIP